MKLSKRLVMLISFFFILSITILACKFPTSQPEATATPAETQIPVATAYAAPSTLTVCLGQEPNTLYPFGDPNAAARSVLASIYDGPIDMVGYKYQPVILTQLPSLENGDAQITKTPVQAGDQVVDADGKIVLLAQGNRVRPAGCRADGCVITYDGTTPLDMDQMIVNFHMRKDLTWADGTPITSDDSMYSFTLASDKSSTANTFFDRTHAKL
jgi:peptide/nickel transport system substrate-binding protein